MCITLARASRMRIKSGDMISREFPICIYLICATAHGQIRRENTQEVDKCRSIPERLKTQSRSPSLRGSGNEIAEKGKASSYPGHFRGRKRL